MSRSFGWLALVLLLGMPAVRASAPSFLGPTGMLLVPTADALAADEMAFSLYGTEHESRAAYIFNYGIRQNLEVGFTRFTSRETVVNAKYNFQPEDGRRAGVAIGVVDLTDEVNTALYVVASKKFKLETPGLNNLRVNAGLASGGVPTSIVPLDSFFGGVSVDVSNHIILMVEHDGKYINFGTSILFGKGVQVNVGAMGDNQTVSYGLSYDSQF